MVEARVDKKRSQDTTDTWFLQLSSPLSNIDDVVEKKGVDEYVGKPISPFWGILLGGRTDIGRVNMSAHSQHMKVPDFNFTDEAGMKTKAAQLSLSLSLVVPYIVNSTDLNAGDLLVLPFDGGSKDMVVSV